MQTRFHNYKRGLVSIDENHRLLGIVKPGRYTGFDTMTSIVGLSCQIAHTKTGIVKTNIDLTQTPPTGVFVTPQGVVVNEDEPVPVSFDTNFGNTFSRADLIIYSHTHVTTPGGAAATLSIVKGPVGEFTLPLVPNPTTQVVVGVMVLPAGATNLSTATYLPKTVPGVRNQIVEMYTGPADAIPVGYTLCDGTGTDSNLITIPDLRDRFIVGYNSADADYNAIRKTGPHVPVSGEVEFLGYQLLDKGKKIVQKAYSVGTHKHRSDYPSYDGTGVEPGGASNSRELSGRLTTNNLAFGIDGTLVGEVNEDNIVPMENRPPYYTVAFIVAI